MLAMAPDPNTDSNSDECYNDNQPLRPRFDDAKPRSVCFGQLLVIAVGLRERSPVEYLWRCVRYYLKIQSV